MEHQVGSTVESDDPIAGAQARNAGIAQFFLGDPQSWKTPTLEFPGGPSALKETALAAGVDLVIHAAYLINVASPNNRIRIPSRKLLQATLNLAAEIGAIGVVVHGGHFTKEISLDEGIESWRKCVDILDFPVPIFIENTAGGMHAMARHVETIQQLWNGLASSVNFPQVGFCLDTCHAHAAGENLTGLTKRILDITGRIDLVHANDSRDMFNSGADRHANLGQGHADPQGVLEVCRAARRADGTPSPIVVETPGDPAEQAADIVWLRDRLAPL
jgi:deoxyribonuclease-4